MGSTRERIRRHRTNSRKHRANGS